MLTYEVSTPINNYKTNKYMGGGGGAEGMGETETRGETVTDTHRVRGGESNGGRGGVTHTVGDSN